LQNIINQFFAKSNNIFFIKKRHPIKLLVSTMDGFGDSKAGTNEAIRICG